MQLNRLRLAGASLLDWRGFAWALLPAAGFLLALFARWPRGPWRASLHWGLIVGLLLVAARGARWSRLSWEGFEEAGALVFLFGIGLGSATWSSRRSPGAQLPTLAASVALLAACGAIATLGGWTAAWMLAGALGVGALVALPRATSSWRLSAVALASFVGPALAGFAAPDRLARSLLAFAAGALVASLWRLPEPIASKRWGIAVLGLAWGALPWLLAVD